MSASDNEDVDLDPRDPYEDVIGSAPAGYDDALEAVRVAKRALIIAERVFRPLHLQLVLSRIRAWVGHHPHFAANAAVAAFLETLQDVREICIKRDDGADQLHFNFLDWTKSFYVWEFRPNHAVCFGHSSGGIHPGKMFENAFGAHKTTFSAFRTMARADVFVFVPKEELVESDDFLAVVKAVAQLRESFCGSVGQIPVEVLEHDLQALSPKTLPVILTYLGSHSSYKVVVSQALSDAHEKDPEDATVLRLLTVLEAPCTHE